METIDKTKNNNTDRKARPKRRHEGIRKLLDGRLLVRVRARDSRTGRYREKEVTMDLGATMSDAISVREDLREQIIAGGANVVTRERFEAAAQSWLTTKLPSWRKSVRDHVADLLDHHILPTLGDLYVDAMVHSDIVSWRDAQAKLRRGGRNDAPFLSPDTVNSRLRLLKQVLADITGERGIPNPAARVPALRVPKKRKRKGLDVAEAGAMLVEMRATSPAWYPITAVGLLTGQRWGALSALEWSQVHWDRGVIVFDRAHVRGVVDDQKTGADVEVPLVPALRAILEAQRQELRHLEKKRRERRAPGTVVLDTAAGLEGRWVFPSRTGALMQPSSLRAPLRAACIAAKVPVISPHGLRYTFNRAMTRITTTEIAQSITGHVTDQMTMHYSWVGNDEKAAALVQVADALVGAAGGSVVGVLVGVDPPALDVAHAKR